MALVPYMPDYDIFFPGVQTFARWANYLDPLNWAPDLYHQIARWFWQGFLQESRRQIGHASFEIARRTSEGIQDSLARFFENARWAVSHISTNLYDSLDSYYRQLPKLNPGQARDLARRLKEKVPSRINLHDMDKHPPSADFIEKYPAPGGAAQRHTPDWMLPLILGLYGDITPTWEAVLEEEEEYHGPSKKKLKTARPLLSSKTADKRRHRSARAKNRTR
ncbi:VP3 structural protein [bat polyomavirus 2a]|nr:VP3 structural protein [bat polyomavirus 2a]AFQ32796.1 VP3 structural protein [bat polyomavirus 2a]